MFSYLLGANILAPIGPKPTRILDVGAGSGRWVVEVAEEFPSTIVTGLDLSPILPHGTIPSNCKFIVGDLTDGLKFDDGTVDLVHSRYRRASPPLMRIINAGVKQTQWPCYMRDVYRVIKPGTGWAQCTEFQGHGLFSEGIVPEDSAIRQVCANTTSSLTLV